MKILHVIFSFRTGGSESMLIDIVNRQSKFIKDIGLMIINDDYDKRLLEKIDSQIKIYCINRKIGSKNVLPILKLNFVVEKINPDIIHFHDQNGIECLIRKNRKTLLTVHDVGLDTESLHKYRKICAISKAVQADIYERAHVDSTLVYNGIEIESIIPATLSGNNEVFRIIQVSRLEHEKKGQHILIEAIRKIKNEYPDIQIETDFIGTGGSLNYLTNLVKKYNLENEVRFLGLKDRNYINMKLHNYDLLVQPSLYEGFGLTVVEGMAAKIPVLVSDNDGPMEIIGNGKYGYYFKKGDTEQCAEKILEIRSLEINQITALTERAYLHIRQNFNITQTVREYIDQYKLMM